MAALPREREMVSMKENKKWLALVAGVSMLALVGCAPEPGEPAPTSAAANDRSDASDTEPAQRPTAEPEPSTAAQSVVQAESCDWETPAVSAGSDAPTGQAGELTTVIVGAWQHTHIDSGAGFASLDQDIRYVFPSSERLLYCQHVPGITDYAEHAADFTLNGTAIELPGAPGFVVSEWSSDTMVWLNRTDDSRYLLQRR